MKWIKIENLLPEEKENGNPVLVRLKPKSDGTKRINGDVVIGVFYKGKFHWNFSKGVTQDIIEWMPLPE